MNAPRYEPPKPTRPTHTFWPGRRRPQPPAPRSPDAGRDAGRDDKSDDDRTHDEPGYGHGV